MKNLSKPSNQHNWNFILTIPHSNSQKAESLHCKYSENKIDDILNQKGKIIASEYKVSANNFKDAMNDFHLIDNLKNADYHILKDNIKYDKFKEGHHCYYINQTGKTGENRENCIKCFTGKISLGCKEIPIFDCIYDYKLTDIVKLIQNDKMFWFQIGFVSGKKWIIDKSRIKKIVKQYTINLNSCPIYDEKNILDIIDKLPNHLLIKDNEFFEFIKVSDIEETKNKLFSNELIKTNELEIKKPFEVKYIVKRKIPVHKYETEFTFNSCTSREYYEFNNKKYNPYKYNIYDFIRFPKTD